MNEIRKNVRTFVQGEELHAADDQFAVLVKGVGCVLGKGAEPSPGWSGRWGRYLRWGGRDVTPPTALARDSNVGRGDMAAP